MRTRKVLFLLISGACLSEALLRLLFDLGNPPLVTRTPNTEYELIGPASYTRWGNDIEINEQGLRMADIQEKPAWDGPRVLLIGDSVIYGGHFLDQTETIASQAERILTKQGCPTRIIPMAASSWGPVNMAEFLKREGAFQADVAFIVLSAHDLYDVPGRPDATIPYRERKPVGAIGDALRILYDLVWTRLRPADPERETIEERQEMSLFALGQIQRMLRAVGVTMHLVYHPTVPERLAESRQEREVFADWARQHATPFLDLTTFKIDTDGYRDNIHPAEKGARQLAEVFSGIIYSLPKCLELRP